MKQPYEAYKGCSNCARHKYESASLLQPYKPLNLEAFSQETPTYNPMSLQEAKNYFVGEYIQNAALDYNTTKINDLRKNVNMTREGLTTLLKNTGNKSKLEEISDKESLNPSEFIQDPITKYVVENASPNSHNIKRDIAEFKRTYVNNMARTYGHYNAVKELGYEKATNLEEGEVIKYGLNDAASTLGISERRVQELVKDYYNHTMPNNTIRSDQTGNKDELSKRRAQKEEEDRLKKEMEEERINRETDFAWGNTG